MVVLTTHFNVRYGGGGSEEVGMAWREASMAALALCGQVHM